MRTINLLSCGPQNDEGASWRVQNTALVALVWVVTMATIGAAMFRR